MSNGLTNRESEMELKGQPQRIEETWAQSASLTLSHQKNVLLEAWKASLMSKRIEALSGRKQGRSEEKEASSSTRAK